MSNTDPHDRKPGDPLPEPVGEDGIIAEKRKHHEHPEDEIDDKDGGLTDIGGGKPDQRNMI